MLYCFLAQIRYINIVIGALDYDSNVVYGVPPNYAPAELRAADGQDARPPLL